MRTANIKMVVEQTPAEIKIKRGSEGTFNYPIGNEITTEVESSSGKSPVKLKAELTNKGILNLNSVQTVKINNEDITVKIKETFELSKDANSIKVKREIQNSKGLPIVEVFVAKRFQEENSLKDTSNTVHDVKDFKNQFSQGVLNGKAKHLEIPPYPSGASASRVTGAVPVRVIFNEEGKVIFAQSIFGHPLLKSAAVEAAMKSTFEPVELDGKIIKVSGIILYNFRP